MSTSTTEAPFVVSHNFCAVRANTVDELRERLTEFANDQSIASLISGFRAAVSNNPISMQDVAHVANPVQQAVSTLAAAGITGTVISGELETVTDKWGNEWTYNHPEAPDLPDGRGKYARKKGVGKTGKAYAGWFDPAKGPKPFAKGAVEAETIWPQR